MQNLGGLAKNIYIGDMATAVFSEIANQKNAGRGLFAETTASHVRHNNNFINNYRYTPTYYYLKDKMGKTDSKRYYFGKLSVAPNVDGIGIGYAYTTDIDEHAFNMGFVSSPDFEDFQTQLGELLLSKSRDENYYKNILKGNSGITSVDQQFIASDITIELKRGDRYKTPEEKDILNPDKHIDLETFYKNERDDIEKSRFRNTLRTYPIPEYDYSSFEYTDNKWDSIWFSNPDKRTFKENKFSILTSYSDNKHSDFKEFLKDHYNKIHSIYQNYDIKTESYMPQNEGVNTIKDYKNLTDFEIYEVKDKSGNTWINTDIFDYYKTLRIARLNDIAEGFKRYVNPLNENDEENYDNYKIGEEGVESDLSDDIKGTHGLNGLYYDEEDVESNGDSEYTFFSGTNGTYSSLITKTNEFFEIGKIKTIINRFNTGDGGDAYKNDDLVSSYNKSGLSRGRNLSLKNGDVSDCRVWTAFKQYSKVSHLIRPITSGGEFTSIIDIQKNYGQLRPNNGSKRLSSNTVLQPNGFVKITPTYDKNETGYDYDNIKNYMFSIENLAWRDIDKREFSKEQYGPNNGRIMWFPPYNLKFSENVNVNWNGNSFIGRGEQIYTYTNTERSGTLDFTLLIDHPSVLNKWRGTSDIATDDKKGKEMELLKYFAGCGELSIDSGSTGVPPSSGAGVNSEPIQVFSKNEKEAILLFFPNAYSYTPGTGNSDTNIEVKINDSNEIINLNNTIDNLKTYEYKDIIGDFTAELNTNTSSINKQSFRWINDFNNLPDDSSGITYSAVTTEDLKKYFPESGDVTTIIGKYFEGDNPRFITVTEDSEDDKKYRDNPSDINSPYIYCASATSEGKVSYKYYVKTAYGTKDSVIDKIKFPITEITSNEDENITLYSFSELVDEKSSYKLRDEAGNIEIISIKFGGLATSVGSVDNNKLARQRKSVIQAIFEKKFGKGYEGKYSDDIIDVIEISNNDLNDVNNIVQKTNRLGFIIIEYKITKKLTISQAEKEGFHVSSNNGLDNENENTNIPLSKMREMYSYTEDKYTYDNEYLYFKNLKHNDNFIYKNIVDKVRFFDPAFHSMTPEGFNARLSFLHQCTRQGPTSKVVGTNFAGNLAFGRAPYCILRIGDFFHTKICIDSMSIQYDNGGGVQWDLNPEGVGVQPMYATVSLNFKFIGGQDISGPIERLQNAVTSNYYANTSIYDPRADFNSNDETINGTYIISTKN